MSVHVLGSLHLDVIVTAPRLPALDETLAGRSVRYAFGGKGGNQAVAAARMGARVSMAGAVGSDDFGDSLLAALDAAGVERSGVRRLPGASGMSVAILTDGGAYGAVIVSGANLAVTGEGAPPPGTRIVLLQNEVPEAANLAAARAARAGGAQVMLNAAPARPIAAELLTLTDILIVNRGEAAALSGAEDPVAAARALAAQGPGAVIVTLGGEGLVAALPEGLLRRPAHAVPVVSTHGAGDAFAGALAARLAAGAPIGEALGFAQAAAALHVALPPERRAEATAAAAEQLAAGGGWPL